jgi:hypothetical protein
VARYKQHIEKMFLQMPKKYGKYKQRLVTHPPEQLTGVDAVQWGMINLRNVESHNIGSHNPVLVSETLAVIHTVDVGICPSPVRVSGETTTTFRAGVHRSVQHSADTVKQ